MAEKVIIGNATLYCADCMDILPTLDRVDAVITDPPYGIGASSKKFVNGTSKTNKDYYADVCWDTAPPSKELIDLIVSKGKLVVAANIDGRVHPTQKPLDLMRWCIDKCKPDPKTILDPFMGSGTTGVAAIQLGRSFIGIEREPKYFDIACKRIEQAVAQGQLFAPEPMKQVQGDLI